MSNFSMDIDVTAPGEFILTTQPLELDKDDNDYVNTPDDGYILTNGTSYATAYVSGLAAAIKSYNPKSNVKEKIVQNTQDIGNTGKDELFGYGLIDFHKTIINVR
ncbi:Minor extracellular protease Epr precursor [compost metagenome]